MKVHDREFYVADLDGAMDLFDTEDEVIDHLRGAAGEVHPEKADVSVSKVTVDGEDWTIKQLPWQQIALRLLQEA